MLGLLTMWFKSKKKENQGYKKYNNKKRFSNNRITLVLFKEENLKAEAEHIKANVEVVLK